MSTMIKISILGVMVLCCTSSFAETVSPFGTFDIKSSLPPNHAIDQIAVRSFVADNSGLYFLIDVNPEQPTLAQSLILHTDWRGTRQKLIQLPPSGFGLYEVEKRQYYEPFAKFARKRDLLSGRVVVPESAGVPPAQDLAGSWRLASQGWSVHPPTDAGAAP